MGNRIRLWQVLIWAGILVSGLSMEGNLSYRIAAASVEVIPIPTDIPLYATIMVLLQLYMASAKVPPGSRTVWVGMFLTVLASELRSIPALNTLPVPVNMMTLTLSSTVTVVRKSINAVSISPVIAPNLSGLFNAMIWMGVTPLDVSGWFEIRMWFSFGVT
jgi:hypothetical protein